MRLADIVEFAIPWDSLFLTVEDLDSIPMHGNRRKGLKNAVAARDHSKLANVIMSWFPQGQDRLILQLEQSESPIDTDKQQEIDDAKTLVSGAFETYGFIVTPKYLADNMVYDDANHRPIKFAQAIDLIRKGREANTESFGPYFTKDKEGMAGYIDRQVKNYMDLTSYAKSAKTGGERFVVISRHPADIATMSTGRPWTSCMDLKDGMYASDIRKALKDGMIVAYLVKGTREAAEEMVNDPTKPIEAIGRIAIKPLRKYLSAVEKTNGHPVGIGWPEDRIYHANRADLSGFRETVTKWVKEKIQTRPSGKYQKVGGYSDSLDDFNPDEHFYDEDKVRAALTSHRGFNDYWSPDFDVPIQAILREPRQNISPDVVSLAFQLLAINQPKTKVSMNYQNGQKSIRTYLTNSEKFMIKMLHKFPEYEEKLRGLLSPMISHWIVGHGSGSVFAYIQKLTQQIDTALTPTLSPYIQDQVDMINRQFAGDAARYKPDMGDIMGKYGKTDPQTAQRTLSKLKVAIRTFAKDQQITIPDGTLNMIRSTLNKAEQAGLDVSSVREQLDGLGTVNVPQ